MKILKIGGSILTDKTRASAAREDAILLMAKEIAQSPEKLVLVHGAGSFGHIPAQRYGLPQKFSPEGLWATHRSVALLNDMIVEALSRAGVHALPVHPLSCLVLRDGRIDSFNLEPIIRMLQNGLMPVLHGDVAMDLTRRAGIVSGDQLVPYLAKALGADVAAVGCNVDGVLFHGKALPFISRRTLPEIEGDLKGSAGVDVTGGMKGKLLELLDLADNGVDSIIFNALKEGNISRALRGELIGTRVGRSN
jgi:isopentenyl phosphate kinase